MFLVFETKESAQVASNLIVENIRNWLKEFYPGRVHPFGLISVDLEGNLRPGVTVTTQWGEPKHCNEGWFLVRPEQQDLGTVPLEIALAEVGGQEMEAIGFPENS